jgi:tetratricopeptide (TPR) repeat protein
MASANKLFAAKDLTNQTKGAKVYEDMAVDEPNSPYVLHNLGLGQYKQGKFDQAVSSFQKALKGLETVKLSPKLVKTILHRFQYHSGNANFKLAAQSESNQSNQSGQTAQSAPSGPGQPQPVNFYQAALENYQKAIEANPDDLDAKYNYELTRLRIQQSQSQQNQNQQSQDQKDQKGQQDQKDQQQSGNQQNQQNQNQQQQGAQSQSKAETKPGEMSKEEAEALLKMAERGEQYQGQLIFGAESPTTKDW